MRVRDLAFLHAGDSVAVVVYGDRGDVARQAVRSLALRGISHAYYLRGGMAGWEGEVMAPAAPDPTDSAAVARFQPTRELIAWFGGRPSHTARADSAAVARRKRRC
jgi:3-mercaptopyruvate sulfurtransferase SseA